MLQCTKDLYVQGVAMKTITAVVGSSNMVSNGIETWIQQVRKKTAMQDEWKPDYMIPKIQDNAIFPSISPLLCCYGLIKNSKPKSSSSFIIQSYCKQGTNHWKIENNISYFDS